MGFKVSLIVLCLLISYSLVEGSNRKNDEHSVKHKESNISKRGKSFKELRIPKEDKLQLIRLHRGVSYRQAGNDNTVEESGGFNFDFDKIPGGAGIKMIYDGLRNVFMSVNRILNFGFLWDGISGIIALFNLETGATFVINGITKMGGFLGYMLQDVTNTINAVFKGAYEIESSAMKLLRSAVRFALDTSANLAVNILDFVNALKGVTEQNLQDILGPIYKLVMTTFKPLLDEVKKLTNSVGNGIMTILEPILGAMRLVTSPIVNIFATILRTTGGIFDGNLFRAISESLSGSLGNVIGGIESGVKGTAGGMFGALTGAINGVGSIFKNIGDAVGSILPGGNNRQIGGYTNINTKTIIDEEPIHFTYANKSDEFFQHFIREGHKEVDLIILYKGGKDNFIAFYNRIAGTVFIQSGNTGFITIFDINNGAGINIKPNSTIGYAIQPPAFLRADFVGPNAKNVSDALTKLSRAVDNLNFDINSTLDTLTIDVVEVLHTLSIKNLLSSIMTGEVLVVVSSLLGNLLRNLAKALPPIIRPSLGVANTLIPFLLNLPNNFVNGIISLIGSVAKRFLGLFTPEFLAELAKTVVIAVLKGLTTPLLSNVFVPLGGISTGVSAALLAANTAVDLLNLP